MAAGSFNRPKAFIAAFVAMVAWGVFCICMAISSHGWTFGRNMQLGLCWTALGLFQLIWGGRKLTAHKSEN
jgi:hypothetical protein